MIDSRRNVFESYLHIYRLWLVFFFCICLPRDSIMTIYTWLLDNLFSYIPDTIFKVTRGSEPNDLIEISIIFVRVLLDAHTSGKI